MQLGERSLKKKGVAKGKAYEKSGIERHREARTHSRNTLPHTHTHMHAHAHTHTHAHPHLYPNANPNPSSNPSPDPDPSPSPNQANAHLHNRLADDYLLSASKAPHP